MKRTTVKKYNKSKTAKNKKRGKKILTNKVLKSKRIGKSYRKRIHKQILCVKKEVF